MPFKLTIFFSERSARIAHAAAAYFHSRKIKLSCDVGFKVFIWYDSATKHSSTRTTHRVSDSGASLNFSAAPSVMRIFDVLYITSIYGIKLCDVDEFGDANTVLHSCFRHYAHAVIKNSAQRSSRRCDRRCSLWISTAHCV